MEALYHSLAYATIAEIRQPYVAPVGCVLEILLKITHREIVESHHVLTVTLRLALGVGHFMLLDFDVIFPGEIAQGFVKRQLLQLHDEADRAPTLPAAEALAHPLGLRHIERRRTVVMERAQPYIIGPATFEGHEVTHHLHYVGGIEYTLAWRIVDFLHLACKITILCGIFRIFAG